MKGAFTKGCTRREASQEGGCYNSPGSERRKIKLIGSNTPETVSQDKGCRSSVSLKRACSVKWG